MVVAIDGPAGSGKSTVAKRVAERAGFRYLDTGAMYRTLTFAVLEKEIGLSDSRAIIAEALDFDVAFRAERVIYKGRDVTTQIRSPEVDKAISEVARIPQVRREMVKLQQRMGEAGDCVVEGRDTTTVVFPQAELKVFLDADFETRVSRRMGDFKKQNLEVRRESVRDDLERRDKADRERSVGPLVQAEDAVYVDTTDLSIEEVVEKVFKLVQARRMSA